MTRIATAIIVAVSVCLPSAVMAQQDQVFGKSGTPTRGVISAISPTQVKIDATGVSRDFEVKDILKVTFGDEPAEVRNARDFALAGQYENALEELKKVAVDQIANDVIKQEVGYYTAFCLGKLALTAGGDKAVAIDQLKNFIGANRSTFHFFEGVQVLGDLNFAAGQYPAASTFYGLLANAPWPEYKMRASVLQARSQAAGGAHAEALAAFEQVLSSGLSTPEAMEQKMHATVGKAVCLAATGKQDEGIKLVEDMIAKNDPSDAALFGRAYNALGACYQKAGKPREALMAYLHTDVLFFADREAHAEALYNLSKLWESVNKADRAVQARGTLTTRYPGSRWATMP